MSKVITLEELKKHTSGKDLWFAIHDKVYDVTKFIEEHPGGEEVLLEQGGSYATEAFEDVGHSVDARSLLEQYEVGVLAEEDRESKKSPVRTTPSSPEGQGQSSITSWLIPLGIAVAAALMYRYVIVPQQS